MESKVSLSSADEAEFEDAFEGEEEMDSAVQMVEGAIEDIVHEALLGEELNGEESRTDPAPTIVDSPSTSAPDGTLNETHEKGDRNVGDKDGEPLDPTKETNGRHLLSDIEDAADSVLNGAFSANTEHDGDDEMNILNSEGDTETAETEEQTRSYEEQRAATAVVQPVKETPPPTSTTPSSLFGGWGGMFSALAEVKARATSRLDRLADAFDPNVTPDQVDKVRESPPSSPGPEQEGKSFKGLFDKLSPKGGGVEKTASSWLDGLDKTFDFASDRLGEALMGGIKKIETTVGVKIEPISSPSDASSIDHRNEEGVSGQDDEWGHLPRSGDRSSGASSPVESATSAREQVESLGKNLYEAGLTTLGRLGRTTANIVVTAKDKLAPMIEADEANGTTSKIDRQELKKPFKTLFEEFSGLDAMETLQLASTQASIKVKSSLKSLNPQQLAAKQRDLKHVGKTLLAVDEEPLENVKEGWTGLDGEELFVREEVEFVKKLVRGIIECISTVDGLEGSLEKLAGRVNSPLPVDTPTLAIYLARYNLAKVLAASLFLMQVISFPTVDEKQVVGLVRLSFGSLKHVFASCKEGLPVEGKRKEAIISVLEHDLEEALSMLRDIVPALQPRLKLAKLNN